MKKSPALVLAVICVTALACARSAAPYPARAQATKALEAKDSRRSDAPAPASADPMLAMNGALNIEVKDVESAARDVQRLAVGAGGFIGDANSGRNAGGGLYATLSMRIPTSRVRSTLESLHAMGKVMLETVTSEDVSKKYFDLATRLRAQRGTEERLHAILATQTGKLSDVIDAEKELERVVGEIEATEGEQHYYEARVAMATLTVELTAPDTTPKPGPFAAIGHALRDSRDALVASFAVVIYAVSFLVPWLVIVSILFLFVKWARTRMRRRLA